MGVTTVALAAGLSGCAPARSVEAYCEVIAVHKDRYIAAMADVGASDNIATGIVGFVSALGDLNRMWEEAAKVAPAGIQVDVEAVRDVWAAQFEAAERMMSNPLEGLASSLMNTITNAGAIQRVDEYTAQSCPETGAMFGAYVPERSASPHPSPAAPTRPSAVVALQGSWEAFGPYLVSKSGDFSVSGPVTLYVPGTGEVEVDASLLMPSEEIKKEEYIYVFDGNDPLLAGAVTTRIPAKGLEPESYVNSVIGIDVSRGTAQLVTRMDLEGSLNRIPITITGTSHEAIIAIQTTDSDKVTTLSGVDLLNEEILWQKIGADLPRTGAVDVGWIVEPTHGDVCKGGRNAPRPTYTATSMATGPTEWTIGTAMEGREWYYCQRIGELLEGRFSVLIEAYSPSSERSTYVALDLLSGTTATLPGRTKRVDPIAATGLIERFDEAPENAQGGLLVADLATGEVVYRIANEQVTALSLTHHALFDGVLYVETTDERLAIDVNTGEELGPWTIYPTAQVGTYTLLSDNTLRLNWNYSGE